MTSILHISYKIRLAALAIVVCSVLAAAHSSLFRAVYNSTRGEPKPICHDAFMGNLQQYLVEQGNKGDQSQSYPNIMGDSQKSKDAFSATMDPSDKSRFYRDYSYVPGLRAGDPKDLILMYMNVPTRFTWHGDNPPLFRKPEWLVFAPSFANDSSNPSWCPEGAQRIDTAEFKRRLRATLSFLKDQKRPNCETVVQQHNQFLAGIKD